MSAPTPPLRGDELLAAVTDSMVALHERYHHRAPVSAKTQMLGEDLLACVMGGVYTEVEKTMIELQRRTLVQETRSAFQQAMQQKFIDEVERLSGRLDGLSRRPPVQLTQRGAAAEQRARLNELLVIALDVLRERAEGRAQRLERGSGRLLP